MKEFIFYTELRQIMNNIVKPMADQINNILSIMKKAHPLYARDYDEDHDGEVFFQITKY